MDMKWNRQIRAEVAFYVVLGFIAVLVVAFALKELFS